MTCVLPTGTGPACAVASVPMPRPVRSLASLSRTGGHKPAAVSDALVGAGSTCGRQGTPDICSVPKHFLWFGLELTMLEVGALWTVTVQSGHSWAGGSQAEWSEPGWGSPRRLRETREAS